MVPGDDDEPTATAPEYGQPGSDETRIVAWMLADFAEATRKIHERGRVIADITKALGLGPTEALRREHWRAAGIVFRMGLEAYGDVAPEPELKGDMGSDEPA